MFQWILKDPKLYYVHCAEPKKVGLVRDMQDNYGSRQGALFPFYWNLSHKMAAVAQKRFIKQASAGFVAIVTFTPSSRLFTVVEFPEILIHLVCSIVNYNAVQYIVQVTLLGSAVNFTRGSWKHYFILSGFWQAMILNKFCENIMA